MGNKQSPAQDQHPLARAFLYSVDEWEDLRDFTIESTGVTVYARKFVPDNMKALRKRFPGDEIASPEAHCEICFRFLLDEKGRRIFRNRAEVSAMMERGRFREIYQAAAWVLGEQADDDLIMEHEKNSDGEDTEEHS